jgi:nickel transport protein
VFLRDARLKVATVAWLAVLLFGSGAAFAHKIKVFASVEGGRIQGYVYFPGGSRAANLTVVALNPNGQRLAEAVTDANGDFSFEVRERCDHQLVVETADGHRATFLVEAKDLAPGQAEIPAAEAPPGPSVAPPAAGAEMPKAADLEQRIAEAVARQVRPLQEQIERSEERRRLQDILGGIGYILGLTGISFYFLAAKRRG